MGSWFESVQSSMVEKAWWNRTAHTGWESGCQVNAGGSRLPPRSSFRPSSSWHCWLVPCASRMGSFSANSLRSKGVLCLSLQCCSTLLCCQSRLPITERHVIRICTRGLSLSIVSSMFLHFEIYPYFTQVLRLHSNTTD